MYQHSYPVYQRSYPVYQRGRGLGKLFGFLARTIAPVAKSIFKTAAPVLKNTAKRVVKTAAREGMTLAKDLIDGEDFKSAVGKRVQATKRKIKDAALEALDNQLHTSPPPNKKKKKKTYGEPLPALLANNFLPRYKKNSGRKTKTKKYNFFTK